jgi:hypothetical protein
MKRMLMLTAALVGIFAAPTTWAAMEGQTMDNVPPAATNEKSSQSGEYAIPPVVPKNLKKADSHGFAHKAVKNLQGQELGQIESVYIDGKTQQPMYAELVLKDSKQIVPIPLSRFKQTQAGLTLDATQQQLERMGPNAPGQGSSADFEHHGAEPLKPNLRQGG